MTFTEFVKTKKGIDTDGNDISELMARYYDEYAAYLKTVKDGCGDETTGG